MREAAASLLEPLDKVTMLLLGGLKLVLSSGVFTVFDFGKVDLSLFMCKLVWLVGQPRAQAGDDARCCPFPLQPAPPALLN